MTKRTTLLLLTDGPMDPDTATRIKDQAQDLLGIKVAVITGIRQALIVEEDDGEHPSSA